MRRLSWLLALFSTACWADIQQASTSTGTYNLVTINGAGLPYSSTTGGTTTVVVDDAMSLFQGGTYSETSHMTVTANGQTTTSAVTETGTYALQSAAVFFTSSNGVHQRVAKGDGTHLTLTEGLQTFYFSK